MAVVFLHVVISNIYDSDLSPFFHQMPHGDHIHDHLNSGHEIPPVNHLTPLLAKKWIMMFIWIVIMNREVKTFFGGVFRKI